MTIPYLFAALTNVSFGGDVVTRQLEAALEARQAKRAKKIVRVVEFELEGSLATKGVVLVGFSVKLDGGDCLITLRAQVDGVLQIAFVGGEDLGAALIKCVAAANRDKLSWRDCRYGT